MENMEAGSFANGIDGIHQLYFITIIQLHKNNIISPLSEEAKENNNSCTMFHMQFLMLQTSLGKRKGKEIH